MEGKLIGEKVKYPYVTQKISGLGHEKVMIRNDEQLIEIISEELTNPINEKKPLNQILEENGIDGMQLLDYRTGKLFENFLFYENNSQALDSNIWFWTVVNLKPMFKTRLF